MSSTFLCLGCYIFMSILFCSAFLYIKKGEIRFWSAICDPTLFRELFLLFVHIFLSIQLFVSVWSINRCFILIRSGFFFSCQSVRIFISPTLKSFLQMFFICVLPVHRLPGEQWWQGSSWILARRMEHAQYEERLRVIYQRITETRSNHRDLIDDLERLMNAIR